MKIKVGHKLQQLREEHKMSQTEFSELLALSPSAYARLERGETQADFEELVRFSEILNVPLHEFLPDTVTFHNHNNGRGAGVIFGNYIVNIGASEAVRVMEEENRLLAKEIDSLLEKIRLLEEMIRQMQKPSAD